MCGVIGLFARTDAFEERLGERFVPMLTAMSERGPDSAGVALYRRGNGRAKVSVRGPEGFDFELLRKEAAAALGGEASVDVVGSQAVLHAGSEPSALDRFVSESHPQLQVLGVGKAMEIYKDVGTPGEIADRYGLGRASGSCMIGHTRMATESAVDVEGSHPYCAGSDLCVVHNGSFANHNTLRRNLVDEGIRFDSENDTEVAARFLQWRLSSGDSLEEAIERLATSFSGFFTLVIGLDGQFAVTRDAYACKPIVVAETDEYVACASEFRALAHLPGIEGADLYEPRPKEVHRWAR